MSENKKTKTVVIKKTNNKIKVALFSFVFDFCGGQGLADFFSEKCTMYWA
jgi:hypothetical protein